MARIDENKEALARIRLAVNEYDRILRQQLEDLEEITDPPNGQEHHWSVGSPLPWTTSLALAQDQTGDYVRFDTNLRAFLSKFVVHSPITDAVIDVRDSPTFSLRELRLLFFRFADINV